ncbi:60S acidic ribosomal protein LP2 [Cryptosporidium canis]|uniref:60S acidic ribosomal protein LP2 n=1 Tax=Cryptosporidium canis TaxID=195482 RepID=A0ABQ8P1W3_9CRYT|nr:60S acidic ribosomal protein LP2 [Cryptosporidium canis]KAJ1605371.1 60S acidic ribosomal protein LP2 [Cryptosporidium canis]
MGMKYVAAYLLCVSSGKEQPTAGDIKKVFEAVGIEFDESIVNVLISNMSGKLSHEVIASGLSKLQSVPTGGAVVSGGAAAASGGAAAESAQADKKEEEEEEEGDLGFSLFD